MEPKVKFVNVSKTYSFHKKQSDKLMDLLSIGKKNKQFAALRDISFEVKKGESIGVIGINGSGKSTLSNLLAQVVEPTKGNVQINGESSLIAISAGLNNNLTGYENIELKCLMLGLKKEEIHEITPSIIEFADIGDFINQPVKNYSSGMKSRLGFSISIHTNPDVLIVDEALSVGDQTFYQKCINKMEEFKQQGKTIFFISHSISQIRSFCDRVLWLHFGEIKQFGDKKQVLKEYKEFIEWFNSLSEKEKKEYRTTMLQGQFSDSNVKENTKILSRSSKIKKRKPSSWALKGQVFLLLILLATSLISMFSFTEDFLAESYLYFNKETKNDIEKQNIKEDTPNKLKINANGLIINQRVELYSDKELKYRVATLGFSDPVLIQEKIGDIYKVEQNGLSGYVDAKDTKIYKSEIEVKDYTPEDLLVFLPHSFSTAYSFYLAHLGMNYEEVKVKLRGLTEELVYSTGTKVQLYQTENIAFLFDDKNRAFGLTILNIDINNPTLNDLLENSHISNKDGLYLIVTKEYKLIINLEEKSLTIELLK